MVISNTVLLENKQKYGYTVHMRMRNTRHRIKLIYVASNLSTKGLINILIMVLIYMELFVMLYLQLIIADLL